MSRTDPIPPAPLAEIWRGPFLESLHTGHAVIVGADGEILRAWGDPQAVILPRSSCKMIQALPLIESGAADAAGLGQEHLALACASHNGAAIHTERVARWLRDLEMSDDDLRCGPQIPDDRAERERLIRADARPCQWHNNCSGKHAGFLTLNRQLGGAAEYEAPEHPVQQAVRAAFEETTETASPGFAIDGCSAPNFGTTLAGLARAMAFFAAAGEGDARQRAARRLYEAMIAHPDLMAGEGRACTELMRAMGGRAAIKTGAEGVFVAIVPERKLGVALKVTDGATRAAECAIAAILSDLDVLDPAHPAARKRMAAPLLNRRGIDTGIIRPAAGLL